MPYYSRDPKRDHNFDNHLRGFRICGKVTGQKRDVMKRHLPAPLSPQNCAPHSINKSLYCRGLNNYLYYFEGLLIKII